MLLRYSRQGRTYIRPILLAVILCLCTLLLSCVAASPTAFAASDPITVTSQRDIIHFPNYIDFDINAKDTNGILTQATLTITFTVPGYVDKPYYQAVPVNHPAHTVALQWQQKTTGSNFYPPGTLVSYTWRLQDNNGHVHDDVTQNFKTIDSRFSWQHLSHGMLQVNWYNRTQSFGQFLLEQATTSIAHISTELGGGLLQPIDLWIYQTDDDFHGSLPPNSYEWVGGEAFPSLREAFIVVTSSSDDTLRRDMPHELTHLVFHQLIEQGIEVPTWFDEGLAVYNQFYHEPGMTARLQEALDTHQLLRLDDITQDFPANSDQAYLAYAQSWNLVAFMYSTFGLAKMGALIKGLNNPQTDFIGDLQTYLGENELRLENQWRIHLNQPPTVPLDQLTPTPTIKPVNQPQQTQSQANTDSSEPLLIGIGALLVLASLICLALIVVNMYRRRRQALLVQSAQELISANAMRWQQNNLALPNIQSSMYAQLVDNPRDVPVDPPNQEYLSQLPDMQAPQE
ncbi:MAG TPA: peptidase MA family metallohydrolase [Ktedonobacteraceae bacterium]|nr:peptidase MA family metallohydrolase [Ktedonobacteraceae bacterium]